MFYRPWIIVMYEEDDNDDDYDTSENLFRFLKRL